MLRSLCFSLLFSFCGVLSHAQNLYYPPITGSVWQTSDAHALGWDTTLLQDLRLFLDTTDTKAFMVLKDGKIVLEYYFNDHNATKPWYWASAGKSLTSVMVACAQADGKLKLTDPTSKYLGVGWTSCTAAEESKITIQHQITMTTGLNDNTSFECTDPECLQCLAAPGSRWAYHNSPYTLLDGVIEGATGQNLNAYLKSRLSDKTGINGLYIQSNYNNVFYSTARVMARFGLLVLGKGSWAGVDVINNPAYVNAMSQTSQNLNQSYGYLWWLNGKSSFMLPGAQFVFPGPLVTTAPADMFAALGKNDQKLYIVPSQNLVVVRMGDKATDEDVAVPIVFDALLWSKLSKIMTKTTAVNDATDSNHTWFEVVGSDLTFSTVQNIGEVRIVDAMGKLVAVAEGGEAMNLSELSHGCYFLTAMTGNKSRLTGKIIWTGK
ncbi:MAG TPA: serine hydrolase [Saprospiraceae bacterium]|nr:serine hydrolase [Saprospiraceae bacterium]